MIEAFNLGPLLIPTRPLILVLSLFFAFWLASRLAVRFALEKSKVKQVVEYSAWIGVFGARLSFVAVNWSAYRDAPWILLYFWQPGYFYLGGLAFGICGALLVGMKLFPAKRRALFTVLASSYLLAILLYISGLQSLELLQKPGIAGVGSTVSDFRLRNLLGSSVELSDLSGQGIVVNFWATWCPPCRREMPLLDDIQKIYQTSGINVVGIAVGEPADQVRSYVESVGVSYPIWVDTSPAAPSFDRTPQIFSRFGGIGFPMTLFIDWNGVIQTIYVGELSRGFLQSEIDKLLDS
jgi:thiol-disulfide isomerase/thioredoxin